MKPTLLSGTCGHPAGARAATGNHSFLRRLLVLVTSLGLLGTGAATAQTVTIGSTSVTPIVAPAVSTFYKGPIYRSSVGSSFNFSRYAYVYTAAELGIPTGATITGLSWLKATSLATSTNNNFEVRLANTGLATIADGTTWGALKTGTTVTYTSTTQTVPFTALSVTNTATFLYSGGNLLVLTDWQRVGVSSGAIPFVANPAPGLGAGIASNAALTDATGLSTLSGATDYGGFRPTLTITYSAPTACTGAPTAGTAVASPANGCGTVSAGLSLTGNTVAGGITYQWQSSGTGVAGSYTNIAGATGASYAATGRTADTYFQAVVTCSGQSATSVPAVVRVYSASPAPYAALPLTEGFESWVSRCENSEVPGTNWRATPITGNASWRRNDQGFSTANWSFPANEPVPYPVAASQGSSSARFHSFAANTGVQGILDLYVNLSGAGTKTLTFDYVNPTGTDVLEVLLSADGGTTFASTPLLTLGTSAAFGGQSVTFAGTSATSVVRFRATSDFGADDLGIDNLRLNVTPACPGVAFAPTTAITQNSATVTFAAASGATNYTVNYTPGGTAQTVAAAGPVVLSGLLPYTLYTVTVTTNCGGGQSGTATTSFRTAIGNDECSGAVALTPGAAGAACAAQTYTTAGATASVVTSPCIAGADGDVWFSFVATNARHSIRVAPTFDFDAVVELRGGACPGTNISCQDAFGSGTAETLVATGLTVGTTYRVRVYSFLAGASSGNFDICITTPANLPCAQVTNALVTNTGGTITASTADFTFTPAAGATDYFLTLVPTAGGTPSTATLAGSPVALTGLTPSTSYTLTISTNCTNGAVSGTVTVVFTSSAPPVVPANDLCGAATAIACGQTLTGTTIGATTTGDPTGTCGPATVRAQEGVFYAFTGTGDIVTVSTCAGPTGTAGGGDTQLFVYSGPCTNLVCVGGNDDAATGVCGPNSGASAITFPSVIGTQYYFFVQGYSSPVNFGLSVTCAAPPTCGAPTNATVATVTGTTATVTFSPGTANTSFTLTATPTTGSPVAVSGAASPLQVTGLTPGTSYTLSLVGNCAGGATSSAVTAPIATVPVNDLCSAATRIACRQLVTGTTAGATTTGDPTACSASSTSVTSQGGVFYAFTGTGDIVTVSTCSGPTATAGDTKLFVYSGSCTSLTCVGGSDDDATCGTNGRASTVTFNSVAGTQYYFFVQGFNGPVDFGLIVNCAAPPACPPLADLEAVNITATTANLSFSPANGASYTITYTPAGGTAVTVSPNPTASPVALSGLTPATTYSVSAITNCAGVGTSAGATATFTTTPVNDLCSAATAIACGQTLTGTTTGATTAGDPTGSCGGTSVTSQGGVFYAFAGTGAIVTVSTCAGPTATTGDTKLFVLSGSCTSLACVGGSDDIGSAGCGTNSAASTVTFPSVAGTQYYFFVQGFSSPVNFGLSVTCAAPPVCNAPTGVTVGSITATTASVNFTPSATALTYTVTATPPTGPPITAITTNGTTSVVNLTGLSASTTYAVSVVSNCAGGATSPAATASFTTLSATLPDLVVSTVQLISGAYNTVTVTSTGTATLSGPLTVAAALSVEAGGTLNSNCQVVSGSGSFTLANGATLVICSADGITATSAAGTIQVTGTRRYGLDASYFYNGTAAQVTGNGLPARTRNISLNNANNLTLTQATSVAQVLTLTAGSLLTNGQAFTLLSDASTGTALVWNAGSGTVVGNATVQRAIDASLNPGLGYRHYSSPVASTPFSDLTTGGFAPVLNTAYNTSATPYAVVPFPNVYGYDETRLSTVTNNIPDAFSKGWVVPSGTLAVGRGYTVNIAGNQLVDFVGTLNNGPLSVGLSRSGGADGGWGFLGNPYPAPLNYSLVAPGDRANLDAAIYVFASSAQYAGSYRSYANGIGGNPIIPSGQGFFVRVSTGQARGSFNFLNGQRETTFSNATTFQRPAADPRPVLALALANAAGTLADPAHVYFETGATAAADAQYDAVKMPNPSGLELATLAGTEALAINGLPLLGAAPLVVPVALRVPAAGRYTVRVDELANFGTATVQLRDALTGTTTALVPGTLVTLNLSSGVDNSRLTLVFNPAGGPLATAGATLAAQLGLYPNPARGRFTLTVPPVAGATTALATLHNALGQVVATRTLTLSKTGTSAEFSTLGLPTGVYALTLRIGNTAATRRVVVE